MPLSSLLHLYRVRLRPRLVQELLAVSGIAVGVALVFAALVANTSLTGAVKQLTSGIVGETRLQLAARGPDGFDERLLAAVEQLPGVTAAAPVLEARANVIGRRGRQSVLLVGGDPRFARLGGPLLRHFTAEQLARQNAIGLPTPMAERLGVGLGQVAELELAGRRARVVVGAQLQRGNIGDLVNSPIVVAPLAYAQRLTGMRGRVTRIFVGADPGRVPEVRDALSALAAGQLDVRDADNDVAVFERAAYPTNQSTAIFSVFSALVGFLFAFSAVLLTVPQRRRFLEDLRLAGHEWWVQAQVLLFDALVLGVLGAAAGLALGDLLSRTLFGAAPGYLAYAFPIGSQRVVTWGCVALAAGAGIVAACVAVLAPLRDLLAGPERGRGPQRAGGRARRPGAVAAGLACVLAAIAIVALVPDAALVALIALTVGLLLLLPALLTTACGLFAAATRELRTPVPTLAALELRAGASRLRTIALAATGAVAVFATVAIGGAHADLRRGLDAATDEHDANADVWVTFPGDTSPFATTPLDVPRRLQAALRRLPGVASVEAYRGSFLNVGDQRAWVQAPPSSAPAPIPPSQLREGDLATATARLRAGGWVVLSRTIAEELNVGVGDPVVLPTPAPTRLRVAGISTNLGWPPGAILLNADDYARAWGSARPSALQLRVRPDASPAAVAAAVERILAPAIPVEVETRQQRAARHRAASREGLTRLTHIRLLVLGSAMLAMAAAMGGMIWQRRPGLSRLKVHGFPEGELWRALLLESALLLGVGCLAGAVLGLLGQVVLTRALDAITGFPAEYVTAVPVATATLALVTSVAVVILALPGWLAARVRPAPGGVAG